MTEPSLTPSVEYLSMRMNRRPLYGYLWIMWLMTVLFIFMEHLAEAEPKFRIQAKTTALMVALAFGIHLLRVMWLLRNKGGRFFLWEKYRGEIDKRVTIESKVVVCAVPILGLVLLIEILI